MPATYSFKGKKHSEETKMKIRISQEGEKSPHWKGDDVGFSGIHAWIKKHKHRPKLCEDCHIKPPYDWSNISGEYRRDVTDWKALCRRCHQISDGRLKRFGHHDQHGDKNPMFGKKHSEESKQKMSEARRRYYMELEKE